MFSSPALRQLSQANFGGAAAKKLIGSESTASRKPFKDLAINNGTPRTPLNFKREILPIKESIAVPQKAMDEAQKPVDEDDLFNYHTSSLKEVEDTYPDICPVYLTKEDAFGILSSYCGYRTLKTPPPEFSPNVSDDSFIFELPENNVFDDVDAKLYELSEFVVSDVSLPQIDSDEDDNNFSF